MPSPFETYYEQRQQITKEYCRKRNFYGGVSAILAGVTLFATVKETFDSFHAPQASIKSSLSSAASELEVPLPFYVTLGLGSMTTLGILLAGLEPFRRERKIRDARLRTLDTLLRSQGKDFGSL